MVFWLDLQNMGYAPDFVQVVVAPFIKAIKEKGISFKVEWEWSKNSETYKNEARIQRLFYVSERSKNSETYLCKWTKQEFRDLFSDEEGIQWLLSWARRLLVYLQVSEWWAMLVA